MTGQDPRKSYERALRRQQERARVLETWEREQDARERKVDANAPAEFPER